MTGVQLLLGLLFLGVTAPGTLSHPNWFRPITNTQVIVIRCAHEYLFQYGTFCIKFPADWNATNPSPPQPSPAPPPQEPPPEEPPATEEPASTQPPAEEAPTARRRFARQLISVGPSFSLQLPSLKPPLSVYLPSHGSYAPPSPPSTVIIQVPGSPPF